MFGSSRICWRLYEWWLQCPHDVLKKYVSQTRNHSPRSKSTWNVRQTNSNFKRFGPVILLTFSGAGHICRMSLSVLHFRAQSLAMRCSRWLCRADRYYMDWSDSESFFISLTEPLGSRQSSTMRGSLWPSCVDRVQFPTVAMKALVASSRRALTTCKLGPKFSL